MADWTVPRTWTADTVVGAADLNTQMRDNLNALKTPPFQQIVTASAGKLQATASTAVPLTGDLSITLSTNGGAIMFYFCAQFSGTVNTCLNLDYNGTAFSDRASGLTQFRTDTEQVTMCGFVTGLPSGSHTFKPTWFQPAGSTMTLDFSGVPAVFWVREVS